MRSFRSYGPGAGLIFLSALCVFCLAPGLGPDFGSDDARAQTSVRGPVIPPPRKSLPPAPTTRAVPTASPSAGREDYEMSTDGGDSAITIGRDAHGDEVTRMRPKKKPQQTNPFVGQPIQVRPIVPMGSTRGGGQ